MVEYAVHGDLRQFLQDRRPGLEPGPQSPEVLTLQDLLSFCYQVAKGMDFLSSRKVNICFKKRTPAYRKRIWKSQKYYACQMDFILLIWVSLIINNK